MIEINFDGLIGPSHNYAGLSLGNVASAKNAGGVSRPRAAALQGLGKMRMAMALGLTQGLLLPLPRPDAKTLRALGFGGADDDAVCAAAYAAEPALFAQVFSASSMWTANAATVSPAPDTVDGRCHLTVANLSTMPHRSIEQRDTEAQLRVAFADAAFAVHAAVPPVFGDEGAANHMRMAAVHDAPGVEIFVYGEAGGRFPARQDRRASEAVARLNGLDPARTLFVQQAVAAIDAGAFHNDVVAVANGNVLFCHEQAFEAPATFYAALTAALSGAVIIEVPASAVSLNDAITSYLFNSQLLTLVDESRPDGSMALILPSEAQENPRVAAYLNTLVAGNGPIRAVHFVAVRESMKNGGGPACLRLRVVADPEKVDPRFLMSPAKADRIEALVAAHWPEAIAPADLGDPALWRQCRSARAKLLGALGLSELI